MCIYVQVCVYNYVSICEYVRLSVSVNVGLCLCMCLCECGGGSRAMMLKSVHSARFGSVLQGRCPYTRIWSSPVNR